MKNVIFTTLLIFLGITLYSQDSTYLRNQSWSWVGEVHVDSLATPIGVFSDGTLYGPERYYNRLTGESWIWNPVQVGWAQENVPFLEQGTTYYVCNDTCQFKSYNEAITFARKSNVRLDTNTVNINIVATRNGDGSKYSFTNGVYTEGGDYSNIVLSSTDSIVYLGSSAAFSFHDGGTAPKIDGLSLIGQGTGYGIQALYNTVDFRNTYIDNFESGYRLIRTTGNVWLGDSIKNCENAFFISLSNAMYINRFKIVNCDWGIKAASSRLKIQQMEFDSTVNVDIQAYQNSSVYSLSKLDSVVVGESISTRNGASEIKSTNVIGIARANVPFNVLTDKGLVYDERRPIPFQESSTSEEPPASSGIRFYYNTDENKLKITEDTVNWKTVATGINNGVESSTTDASGDIVVTHGLTSAPTTVTVTGGTNDDRTYQVLEASKNATTFTVRVYDAGTPVNAGAAVFNWIAVE